MASRIEELKERVAKAQAEKSAAALTPDEQEEANLIAEEAKAKEDAAAYETTRRTNDMTARVAAARSAANGKHLVAGVDLLGLFPIGERIEIAKVVPGYGGVIVVRSPTPEASDTLAREFEHKKQSVNRMLSDLLCASVIDPKVDDGNADAIRLRAFCDAYPDAAAQAAGVVRKLGGAKVDADKRGRE